MSEYHLLRVKVCVGQMCMCTLNVHTEVCDLPYLYIPGRDPLSTQLPHIPCRICICIM